MPKIMSHQKARLPFDSTVLHPRSIVRLSEGSSGGGGCKVLCSQNFLISNLCKLGIDSTGSSLQYAEKYDIS